MLDRLSVLDRPACVEHCLPSFATCSAIPPPPISKMTFPTGARHAQYSKVPLPLPIRVSLPCPVHQPMPSAWDKSRRHTLMQTGISGKTRVYTLAPLTGLIPLLSASEALCSCFALNLVGSLTRIPKSPCSSVVPAVLPPVRTGILPLCAFLYFVRRGVRELRARVCCCCSDGRICDTVEVELPLKVAEAEVEATQLRADRKGVKRLRKSIFDFLD